jgi:flagellar basal body-associated protein FliL
MKMKIMIGVAVLVVIGVAAFVVAGKGEDLDPSQLAALRGTEGYYAKSEPILAAEPYGAGEITVNLKDQWFLKISFDAIYKNGLEWVETPEVSAQELSDKASQIRSRLLIVLSGLESTNFNGAPLEKLLEEIKSHINEIVFPLQRARVEKIVLKNMLTQKQS